jgi:lipopolysaccharide transport system ATP-binding protein
MSETVISVENLSKRYFIGAKEELPKTKGEAIRSIVGAPFKYLSSRVKEPNPEETFWALKDVSFEVKAGEVIGLIGRNGAGKSTLLKILSRITKPTSGCVKIRGRVGSLLEVGTGFHPELTGRENIYLNGTILGMTKKEIDKKFDEIVDFAEIEKFLDTPVKRYSSGMYVRLAFAVAAHLETEILVVDEVLAVGDSEFQKKCLGKMGDIATKEGRTVLFVSHNMAVLRQFCVQGIFLSAGNIIHQGDIIECTNKYIGKGKEANKNVLSHITKNSPLVYIDEILINNKSEDQIDIDSNCKNLEIIIRGKLVESIIISLEAKIIDIYGITLGFFSPDFEKRNLSKFPSGNFIIHEVIKIPKMMRGSYYLSLYLTIPNHQGLVDIPNAVQINSYGVVTDSGYIFEYNKGEGWIFMDSC